MPRLCPRPLLFTRDTALSRRLLAGVASVQPSALSPGLPAPLRALQLLWPLPRLAPRAPQEAVPSACVQLPPHRNPQTALMPPRLSILAAAPPASHFCPRWTLGVDLDTLPIALHTRHLQEPRPPGPLVLSPPRCACEDSRATSCSPSSCAPAPHPPLKAPPGASTRCGRRSLVLRVSQAPARELEVTERPGRREVADLGPDPRRAGPGWVLGAKEGHSVEGWGWGRPCGDKRSRRWGPVGGGTAWGAGPGGAGRGGAGRGHPKPPSGRSRQQRPRQGWEEPRAGFIRSSSSHPPLPCRCQ